MPDDPEGMVTARYGVETFVCSSDPRLICAPPCAPTFASGVVRTSASVAYHRGSHQLLGRGSLEPVPGAGAPDSVRRGFGRPHSLALRPCLRDLPTYPGLVWLSWSSPQRQVWSSWRLPLPCLHAWLSE